MSLNEERKKALRRIKENIKEDKKHEKKLKELYNKVFNKIRKEIERVSSKATDKNGNVSINQLKKKAEKADIKELKDKINELLQGDNNNYSIEILNENMPRSSDNKLDYLKKVIATEAVEVGRVEEKLLNDRIKKDFGNKFSDKERLKIIDELFKNRTFSDNIWANQEKLISDLKQNMVRSVLKGENPTKWSNTLRENMKNTYKKQVYASNRIAVTEGARVSTQIQAQIFKKDGFKKVVWVAEPTACPICAQYDGTVFRLDSNHEIPPQHPFCRCSIAGVEDDREVEE